MGFESDWLAAKRSFETATGKKKPSGKFMGVFHTSGVSDRLKKIDAVLTKGDVDDIADTYEALGKDASAYSKILLKTAKDDADANYGPEVKKLSDALDHIVRQTGLAVNKRVEELRAAAKAKAEDEAVKEALGLGAKMKTIVKPLLEGTRHEVQVMEDAIDEANRCLGEVITGQMGGNARAARSNADLVKKSVDTLPASRKKIEAAKARAEDVLAKGQAALFKLPLPKTMSVGDISDDILGLVLKFEDYLREAKAHQETGAATIKKAAEALRGALDTEAAYADVCEKLLVRATTADLQCGALVRDIGGQSDVAALESTKAEEAKSRGDAQQQATSTRTSTDYVRRCRIGGENAHQELRNAGVAIRKAIERLPAVVRANPKFHATLRQVNQHFEGLRELNEELNKALRKCDRTEAQLNAL